MCYNEKRNIKTENINLKIELSKTLIEVLGIINEEEGWCSG